MKKLLGGERLVEKEYVFTRLRLADSEHMMLETSMYYDRFPGITKEKLEICNV